MAAILTLVVRAEDGESRLDRFLRRRLPGLTQGRIEKLLRTGALRVDGARAKSADRVGPGAEIRVPAALVETNADGDGAKPRPVAPADADFMQELVIHDDADMIVLNKPPGIAVQGGSGVTRHIDALLPALAHGEDVPKLIHRLDRDTSGVLILGRTPAAAAALSKSFRSRVTRKIYWAVTLGAPNPREGEMRGWLKKAGSAKDADRELVRQARHGEEGALFAITDYAVISHAANKAAWVALKPVTGRTHQLRFHMAESGTAIVGDGKYTCAREPLPELDPILHLHARALEIPHPRTGKPFRIMADLPEHMARTFDTLGFDLSEARDPFEAFPKR
jgi:23S rRNA pseudouridine955/2504/2580 synthase